MRPIATILAAALLSAAASGAKAMPRAAAAAQKTEAPPPEILKRAGFDQNLGAQLPLDAPVRNEAGETVPLGSFFTDRPVVLSLVYYNCPMLCNLVLNGLVDALKQVALEPGRDYRIVTLSFNHEETPPLAARKKAGYIAALGRAGAEHGWHFLTAGETAIGSVAKAAGFRYAWDEKAQEFAHGSGIMVATPDGKLSHYFYGVQYQPRDLRLALVEASSGRIGSPVDQLMLFCYHYDPLVGGYSAAVMNVLRAGCLLTAACVAAFLGLSWRRERKPVQAAAAA